MKLNSIQKKILQKHWNNYRYIYNKTVNLLTDTDYTKEVPDCIKHLVNENEEVERFPRNVSYSKFDLRNLIVPESCNSRTPWLLESGSNIRAQAVFQAHSAYTTCINNIKAKNIKMFKLKYKLKKIKTWTMNIDRTNLTRTNSGISLYLETGIMKTNENFEINHDCKIHCDGYNYYILVPYEKSIINSKTKNTVCALDPGMRKFQTIYSEEECISVGIKASERIYKLLLTLDKVKCKKTADKIRRKIKNLQTELHNKTTRFLCNNYNKIIIPKLSKNNDIINKKTRKINKKSVRQMVVLGHSMFVEKLKTKAEEYTDVQVDIVTEEYTSQICSECCRCTKTSEEIYKCKYCNFTIDRDILGSRNIYLKYYNLLKINKC